MSLPRVLGVPAVKPAVRLWLWALGAAWVDFSRRIDTVFFKRQP